MLRIVDREEMLDQRDRKLEGAMRARVPFTSTGSGFMAKGSPEFPLTDYDSGDGLPETSARRELMEAYRDLGVAGRGAGPVERLVQMFK